MSKQIQLAAENRTVTGKKVNQLRREGIIPAVVYGHHVAAKSIQVNERELNTVLRRAGMTHLLNIQLAGGDGLVALVKDIQRESTTQRVVHVDFQAVSMDEPITTTVPVLLEGEAPAVEDGGGTLLHSLSAVEIRALPANLIDSVVVDISALRDFDAAIHVSDLKVPANVEVLNDPDELVAKVTPPRVQEEEEGAEGTGESPRLPEVISETEAERRRGERAEE